MSIPLNDSASLSFALIARRFIRDRPCLSGSENSVSTEPAPTGDAGRNRGALLWTGPREEKDSAHWLRSMQSSSSGDEAVSGRRSAWAGTLLGVAADGTLSRYPIAGGEPQPRGVDLHRTDDALGLPRRLRACAGENQGQ